MSLLLNLLGFALVLVCLFLGLLILVQLPKKEAGMGTAFGGDAAVAMFGAGSGNALTKMTKYAASAFLVLCLALAVLYAQTSQGRTQNLRKEANQAAAPAPAAAPAVNPALNLTTLPAATNNATSTNAPAAAKPATNAVTPGK